MATIEIECSCRAALSEKRIEAIAGYVKITTEPCDNCITEAKDESYSEGYAEGFSAGEDEQ